MTLEVTTNKAHIKGMVTTLYSLFVKNTGLIEDDRRRGALTVHSPVRLAVCSFCRHLKVKNNSKNKFL